MSAIVTGKRCSKCGVEKPPAEYYKDPRSKDGLASECKLCRIAVVEKWRSNNRTRISNVGKRYYATHKDEKYKSGVLWKKKNPEKVSEIQKRWIENNPGKRALAVKEYRKRHPDKIKEYRDAIGGALLRAWRKKNKPKLMEYSRNRRAMKRAGGGKISAEEWQEVIVKYGSKCLHPGCERTDITMDHVVSLKNGGTHTVDNVQPLCKHHNSSKNTRNIDYRPDY